MISNKLISTAFAQTLLRERLGYDIPKDDQAAMLEEQTQILDATGARLDEAAAGGAVV